MKKSLIITILAGMLLVYSGHALSQIEALAYTIKFDENNIAKGTEITSENLQEVIKIADGNFKNTTLTNLYAINCKRSNNGIVITKGQRGEAAIGFGISTEDQSAITKVVIYTTNSDVENTFSCSFNLEQPSVMENITSNHTYSIENSTSIFDVYIEITWGKIDIQKIEFYVKQADPETSIIANTNEVIDINKHVFVKDVRIRSDESDRTGQILVNAPIESHNGITYEKKIDDRRWYFFSLPYDCPISQSEITSEDGTIWTYGGSAVGGNYIIRYYDQVDYSNGAKHGWRDYDWNNKPLKACQGYIIGLFPKGAKATIRFRSSAPYRVDPPKESTFDFGPDYVWYNSNPNIKAKYSGWNLIGSPYLHNIRFGSIMHTTGEYSNSMLSIPNPDGKTYTQKTITEILADENIRPFSACFIQVGSNNAPFMNTYIKNPELAAAPTNIQEKSVNRWKLAITDSEGRKDETNILSIPGTTEEYEIGYDLLKLKGYADIPQIYTIEKGDELAFNAQEITSSVLIELGMYLAKDDIYKLSIKDKTYSSKWELYLYDSETGIETNLNTNDYSIFINAGEYRERFYLRIEKHGIITAQNYSEPIDINIFTKDKFLYINGLNKNNITKIYNLEGKIVCTMTNKTEIMIGPLIKGIYQIVILDKQSVTKRVIIY